MYVFENRNPKQARVGDCVIRAISSATNRPWKTIYARLTSYGYMYADMPSSNWIWDRFLQDNGFVRETIENTCATDCYTVRDFCEDHPVGTYILGTGSHVVCVKNGDYFDTYDSGDMVPLIYYRRA